MERGDPFSFVGGAATLQRSETAPANDYAAYVDPATTRIRDGWGCASRDLSTDPAQGGIFADGVWRDAATDSSGYAPLGRAIYQQNFGEKSGGVGQLSIYNRL